MKIKLPRGLDSADGQILVWLIWNTEYTQKIFARGMFVVKPDIMKMAKEIHVSPQEVLDTISDFIYHKKFFRQIDDGQLDRYNELLRVDFDQIGADGSDAYLTEFLVDSFIGSSATLEEAVLNDSYQMDREIGIKDTVIDALNTKDDYSIP